MTPKQQKIYHELIQGKTYEEIANTLFISRETVKTHCRNIYKQYSVKNRKELMAAIIIDANNGSNKIPANRNTI